MVVKPKDEIDEGSEVLLLGGDLELNGTLSTDSCPRCHGGLHHDKAFSITRFEDGLVYNCFRASCDCSGFVPLRRSKKVGQPTSDVPSTAQHNKAVANANTNPYKEETQALGADQAAWLRARFNLTDKEVKDLRVTYNPKRQSFVFPVMMPSGGEVGKVDRVYGGKRKNKAILYREYQSPKIHFPWVFNVAMARADCIILVEDHISAGKVNRYHPSAALMGTSLGDKEVNMLKALTDRIIFALDKDATTNAIELKRKYSGVFKSIGVLSLQQDPKDMSDEVLKGTFDRQFDLD